MKRGDHERADRLEVLFWRKIVRQAITRAAGAPI